MSSTRMEAMAIITAVVITPPSAPLVIHTDSQSAMSMTRRAMAPVASRELYKSPDSFLWLHLRSWLRLRQAPTTVTWVRGHSGDVGNEMADRLAASAHDDPSAILWTTRMPPPSGTPFWILHDKRVIPRRPRRLLREQDEEITAERLKKQVNEVPGRLDQNLKEITYILHALRGTIDREGKTQMKKCWNITNLRDCTIRAFGYKLLMGFLPTLERQRSWYPEVYNPKNLIKCAKCEHEVETLEHLYGCADHSQVEQCFRDRFRALQPQTTTPMDPRELLPWRWLGGLQGRIYPSWEIAIPLLQHGRRGTRSTAGSHRATPPRLPRDVVCCHMATAVSEDRRARTKTRAAPKCKDPPDASCPTRRWLPSPTITYSQAAKQLHRLYPRPEDGLSPLSFATDAWHLWTLSAWETLTLPSSIVGTHWSYSCEYFW